MKKICVVFLFWVSFHIGAFEILSQFSFGSIVAPDCNSMSNGEFLLLDTFLRPGDILFDVGANIGEYSGYALKACPTSIVYSFEPVPNTFRQLQRNLNSYKNVHVFCTGLSDYKGSSIFYYVRKDSGCSGLFERNLPLTPTYKPKPIIVSVTTLDDFCSAHAISSINFLKIDTEGAEHAILNGAQGLLKNHSIRALQFEYGGTYIDAHTSLQSVLKLLSNNNYVLFKIAPVGLIFIQKWDSALEDFQYSNYFAICPEELPRITNNPNHFYPMVFDN